jgi:predicted DCC family thiol-disulfide oxidoreductase YuxK
VHVNLRDRVDRFFFAPAAPSNLGAVRAGLFSLAAWWALQENVTRDAALARVNWRPTSYFHLLGGPPSAGTLRVIQIVLVTTAIFAAAGLFTRAAQLVASPLAAYLLGFDSNFGKINHRSILLVLLLLAILPARLGDGFSIDRLRAAARTGEGSPRGPDPRYRWPLALAQVCAVSVYFFAGISKLVNGGPAWFTADSFRRFLYVRLDQLASPPRAGLWLADHASLAQLAAIASVAFELSVVLILFWPRLKLFVLPGIVVFHELTRALVRIDFTRTMMAAFVPLIDYRAIGVRIRERTRRPRFVLLIDGACSICRRTGAVLKAADALDRLEIAGARDEAQLRRLDVDRAAALSEMHLVSASGRVYAGFDAYRRMTLMLPVAWPVAPLLSIPGVRALGRRAYRRVAGSRLPVLHCTSASCTIGREDEESTIVPARQGE